MFKETIIRKLIRDVVQETMEDAYPNPTDKHTWEGGITFSMNLRKDKFIHFTTREKAEKIIKSGYLKSENGSSVFAVSSIWGTFGDAVLPKGDARLVAIRFKTKTMPKYGFIEEVVWNQNVNLDYATIVSYEMGRQMLQSSGAKTYVSEKDKIVYESLGSINEDYYHQTSAENYEKIMKHGFDTPEIWAGPDDLANYGEYVVEIDAPIPKKPFVMDDAYTLNFKLSDDEYIKMNKQLAKNREFYENLGGEVNPETFNKLRELGYDEVIEDNGDRAFLYPERIKITGGYKLPSHD